MKQKFLKLLADLRFAITILLIIAFISIIGTIIEQDQSIEIYKLNYPLTNKLFGILSWDLIIQLGLFTISLISIFFFNIFVTIYSFLSLYLTLFSTIYSSHFFLLVSVSSLYFI